MVFWQWWIIVVALRSVLGELHTDLPLVGRENAGIADDPPSNLSEIESGSGMDDVQTNALAELIIETGIWQESSGVESIQTDTLDEPTVAVKANPPKFDAMDHFPSQLRAALFHNSTKNYSAEELYQLFTMLFTVPSSKLEKVFGLPKHSKKNPFHVDSKVVRSDDNGKKSSQLPIGSIDPFQPVKDAMYQYAEITAKQEMKQDGPKKAIPLTLADLNRLSDDEIRDLSYQHIPLEEHAKFIYRQILEELKNPFIGILSCTKIDGFWNWFKSVYVPKNRDNIDVKALADAEWFGFRRLQDSFEPSALSEEAPGFFESFLAFFKTGEN